MIPIDRPLLRRPLHQIVLSQIAVIAIVTSALWSGSASAAGPLRPFKQGFWSGGAYTDERTGAFTHCSAGVAYNSGINLFVLTTRTHRWWLGFIHPAWSLTPNAKISVQLRFGGIARFRRFATIPNGQLMLIPLPNSSRAIDALRRAPELKLIAEGHSFLFKLNETSGVLDHLMNCARTSMALEVQGPSVGAMGAASASSTAEFASSGVSALASLPANPTSAEPETVPAGRAAAGSVTTLAAPVEVSRVSIVTIGALMGAVGQGVRVILMLWKVRDTRPGDKITAIEPTRLTIGLFFGVFVGVMAAIGSTPGSPMSRMALLGAAGYCAADVVERLFARTARYVSTHYSRPFSVWHLGRGRAKP